MSFVRATSLAILATVSLGWALPAAASPAEPPVGTSLSVHAEAASAAAGSVVRITGTLTDSDRQPVAGAPIDVAVTSAGVSVGDSGSTTLEHGRFEAYAPVPDQAPASGTVQIVVRFPGSADARPAEALLTVPVLAAPAPKAADLLIAAKPNATKKPSAKPSPSATSATGSASPSATPAPAPDDDPLLRNVLWAAGGLLAVLVLLIAIGAVMHRRRSR